LGAFAFGLEDAMVLGSLPAVGRRAIAVMGVLAFVAVTSVSGVKAQQAPAAPPDPFKFSEPSLLLFITVKGPGVEAFEQAMNAVHDSLVKSDKPERKHQLQHWQMFKSPVQAEGAVIFIWRLDEVSKDVSYDPFKIIGEGGMDPKAVGELYAKVSPSLPPGSITMIPLTLVANMKGGI
jgi:hypothetical protein